ncbi:MAG: hypothetical protein A2086_02250 [Spirochaetes bacterium GWD1_27_9]|nr:MAG: hypothetical protein A2Y34_16060 [Spirochaetes bacterium GWC1_27_15]OHD29259.1 MAG: hypothetical protein A2086_02250 [Spirochaetes bacterium GWD1_27_9]
MKVSTKLFQKNAFIYLEGKNNGRHFYIVKTGQIKIKRKNPILGDTEEIKGNGYIFGIIQSLTGIADDEVVQAVTDCEVFVISKDKIDELYTEHPKVILKILSEYSEILRRLDKDLIRYEFFSVYADRKEKIFDIVDKYISIKEEKKASHLLKISELEFKNDPVNLEKYKSVMEKLPSVEVFTTDQIITERKFPPQSVIFTEFETGDTFFIIKKGKVKITKLKHDKEMLLAILSEGDIFGEMGILNDKPRSATAVAEVETNVMIINKKGIDKLPPTLFVKILEFLSKRIWFVQQQLICFKIPVPTAKLYYLLASKIKQVIPDPKKEFDKSFTFKFPIEELYQMLDFDKKTKDDIEDFLNDKNVELYPDSIRIRNIGELFDKYFYNYSRALYVYNGMVDKS